MQNITWSLYGIPAPKGFESSFDKAEEDRKAEKEEAEQGTCPSCGDANDDGDDKLCFQCSCAKYGDAYDDHDIPYER